MITDITDEARSHSEYDGHVHVYKISAPEIELYGYIALHMIRGQYPCVGGTRYYSYKSDNDALEDVLRLSKSMSYKCALAGVPYGGGKATIIAPSTTVQKSPEFLKAYAEILNELNGVFRTGEDVGMTFDDIEMLAKDSGFIIGSSGKTGDPSPWAALSVFCSIEQSIFTSENTTSLIGKTVAIKGVGKVGAELARLLVKANAKVIVSDIDPSRTSALQAELPSISIVDNSKIHSTQCDVYAPCALGKEFSVENIDEIGARIICGSANNQLVSGVAGEALNSRGILYIPDYVANSGGLINVVAELDEKGYTRNSIIERVKGVKKTVEIIIQKSLSTSTSTSIVADALAKAILENQNTLL
ncbi:MAG: hypothetical protein RL641_716 [Candidatus Parcubacteria bacterium]|jgi:leucine dehydrogenase